RRQLYCRGERNGRRQIIRRRDASIGAIALKHIRVRGMRASFSVALVAFAWTIVTSAQNGPKTVEWRYYGADSSSTKYSPLDQINRDNVKNLRITWRWKTDNLGPRPDYNFQATPIMVGGVLYTTAGTRRDVAAIDAATGETIWIYRYDEGVRAAKAPIR